MDQGAEGAGGGKQAPDKDMVPTLDDYARFRRTDRRRAQWSPACADIDQREHGGSQTWRIRANTHV